MATHPVLDDNLGDYDYVVDPGSVANVVDPGSVANIVSYLLQIVVALVGVEKAKAALDWETVQAANAAADYARSRGRAEADEAYRKKFGETPK